MTLDAMQRHEPVALRHEGDFRRQGLLRLVRRYVRGTRVLDLRCLSGSLAVELAAAGMEVRALDGCRAAVERTNALARRRGVEGPIAQRWDLRGLIDRVGTAPFDTVLCVDVLNHVRDDQETVAEMVQALREGGRLILAVPADPALLGARDRSLGHLRRYTKSSLRRLLEPHGLRVDLIRYWNFAALPLYALIERGLRARVPDGLRYVDREGRGSLLNRFLTWWYARVENRLLFPRGLTLFAIAHKPAGGGSHNGNPIGGGDLMNGGAPT